MPVPSTRGPASGESHPSGANTHGVGLRQAARVWALVALNSFGGPAGQVAVMHRFLVEERRWLSEQRFLHALSYCMLLPGPEAQQLAVYVGWLLHGVAGGVVAGVLFVLPGMVAILLLSLAYVLFAGVAVVEGVLFGLQAAVVAVVVEAVLRIGRRAIRTRAQLALAAIAFAAIFFAEVPFPVIIVAAAVFGYVGERVFPALRSDAEGARIAGRAQPPTLLSDEPALASRAQERSARRAAAAALVLWLVPVALVALVLGPGSVYTQMATFFSSSAVVTFGGAYAVLAYISQVAVETYGWLRPGEMLTGLGMAETTPGPLIMVVQFVAFLAAFRDPGALPPLAAGVMGSLLVTWVTFAPCFFFIFAGAPYIERLRGNRRLTSALSAVTAAVVGVVLNLAVWFALATAFDQVREVRHVGLRLLAPVPASVDPAAVALAAVAGAAIFRFKLGVVPTLLLSGALGALLAVV